MRQSIAESLEPRWFLTAVPALHLLPPRLQSVRAGVDAAFSLGRLKEAGTSAPFTVRVQWNDGSADTVVVAFIPGVLPESSHLFSTIGIHIVDVSLSDPHGLTTAGTFKIRVLPGGGGITGVVYRDVGVRRGPPLRGYTFYLDLEQDGQLDSGDPTAVSNASGTYRFSGLLPGVYQVRESLGPQVQLASPATGSDLVTVGPQVVRAAPFADVVPMKEPAAGVTLTTVASLGGRAQYSPPDIESMQIDADGNIYAASDQGGVIRPHGLTSGELFRIPAGAADIQLPAGSDWFQSQDQLLVPIGMELDGYGHLYLTADYSLDGFPSFPTNRYNTSDGTYDSNLDDLSYTSLPIFDEAGNAYLTEENSSDLPSPGDAIIEIPVNSSTLETIANFNISYPANLTQDATGNLYGELLNNAFTGNNQAAQVLFEVAAGTHTISTLYTFAANDAPDFSITDMVSDPRGDLFATTQDSNSSTGTVFELRAGSGTITQLGSFSSAPSPDLTIDRSGNVFGEVPAGGRKNDGEIFEIAAGTGALSDICTFTGANGRTPDGLIIDTAGNLFGITSTGGTYNRGTAFKITGGTLAFTTLAEFNATDGFKPSIGLYADGKGNLYGATTKGGEYGAGTIFKISGAGFIPSQRLAGAITGQVAADGKPVSDVTVSISGGTTKLSTTTQSNGQYLFDGLLPGNYTVQIIVPAGYQLDTPSDQSYHLTVSNTADSNENFSLLPATLSTIIRFSGTNGSSPGDLIMDSAGDLFGNTAGGGAPDCGTVFELPAGSHDIKTIAAFDGADGRDPQGTVYVDRSGNIFGTTCYGGQYGDGTVFEILAGTGEIFTLHSFNGYDGLNVSSGLAADASGNLYGTASAITDASGVDDNSGSIFKIAAGTLAFTTLVILDGISPSGTVVADSKGNVFTSTVDYDLIELPAGSTTIKIINPAYSDNGFRSNGITTDTAGHYYVTTDFGTLYDIAPDTDTLSAFLLSPADGLIGFPLPPEYPVVVAGIPVVDSAGDIFGDTGDSGSDGIIYEIPAATGVVTTLFNSSTISSEDPDGNLVADSRGDLFGTTTANGGTIFEISDAGFVTEG